MLIGKSTFSSSCYDSNYLPTIRDVVAGHNGKFAVLRVQALNSTERTLVVPLTTQVCIIYHASVLIAPLDA